MGAAIKFKTQVHLCAFIALTLSPKKTKRKKKKKSHLKSKSKVAYVSFCCGSVEINLTSIHELADQFYKYFQIQKMNETLINWLTYYMLFSFFFSFGLFGPLPIEYRGSQARGPIGSEATSLHHSHSNARSLSASYTAAHGNPGSLTHWGRPGLKPASSWILVKFISP